MSYHPKYIKSPLNYIGGKYRLLPQLIPYFPKKVNMFIDLFSGGANVGINVNADKIIFNDINTRINGIFRCLQNTTVNKALKQIQLIINKYNLSKTNKEGFLKLRKNYNNDPSPMKLYVLVAYSFNYQFRFNNNMQYNNPFGKNRSYFSPNMKKHLIEFMNKLDDIDATFVDRYFTELNIAALPKDTFIYADPPYLITDGTYNDTKGGFVKWSEKQELQLYDLLDKLNRQHIRFALSNVFTHKGKQNNLLRKWVADRPYGVNHLKYSYKNSSYNTKHLASDEVLITNY